MDLEANKHTVSGGPSYQGEYFKFGYDSMMKPAISVIFTGKSPFCNRWVSLKINHSTMFPIFNQDRQLAHFQTHQVEQHSKPYVFPFWSWLVFTGAIPSGFAAATWDGSPVSGTPPAGVAGSSPKKSSFLFLAAAESTSTGPGFLLDTLTLATTHQLKPKSKAWPPHRWSEWCIQEAVAGLHDEPRYDAIQLHAYGSRDHFSSLAGKIVRL